MSYTADQLNALKAAAAKGVLSVTTDGNTVTYASMEAMRDQIAVMQREIDASTRKTYANPVFSKGT